MTAIGGLGDEPADLAGARTPVSGRQAERVARAFRVLPRRRVA
ncbi:hypothetical protein ACFV4N_40050 [Actinosynnema sp. NPDC059797]